MVSMKVIWEESDVKFGLVVTNGTDSQEIGAKSILGYLPDSPNVVCITDFCDGMVTRFKNLQECADYLSRNGYKPVCTK